MISLDMRTVILSTFVSSAICTGVMALLWLQSRRRLSGTGFWLADFFMQILALALITLRGVVPDWLSVVGGNALVIGGTILLYIGLERFVGKTGSQVQNYVLLVAFIAVHTYFTVVQPDLAARNINFSLWLLVICFQCAWLMLRRVDVDIRPMTRAAGLVFAGYCLASAIRVGVELVVPPGNDFFKSGPYDTLVVMTYQMLFIALTFSLFLMVNRRLLTETMASLTERQRVEAALRLSEEKFSKAFYASPDAILISRLSDGRIVEVNEGFCRLTEYSRQEALAHSSLTLNIWANPQDRDRLIAALQENKSVRDHEFDFYSKSGKSLRCIYSGEIIYLGDEAHILSVVRDISERKQAEENLELETVRLQAQLALHKMMDAPQDQLLDFTLEAIIKATQSRYGFIGLMDKAEEVVTIYTWSKNTMQECGIESNSMNFPICEAGLWGECVRQRKPVIVNAYDDYPGKKGFPAGHVPIERFLSVPIFDGGRIVATAAAANKASDYVESDGIALTLLVERLWGILRRKRAEEALRESEAQARRLAEENAQLLREINHRVGNNLYLLSILVKNQLEQAKGTETRNVLLDLGNRLQSMSSIHKLLQGSNWHPVELELLASRVVHGVVESMATDKHIEVIVAPSAESVLVGAKQAFKLALTLNELATNSIKYAFSGQLALTLNELATNSIKYAFSGQEEGRIEIKIGKESDGAPMGRLEYRDNGRGWPQDVLSGEREGTGLYLVRSTIEYEMEGQVVLSNDGGAVMNCKFNLDQAY